MKYNMLVYGESGVGKTRFSSGILEVPELNPCLFISAEKRIGVIKQKSYITPDFTKDYKEDLLNVVFVDTLDKLASYINFALSSKSPYKSVVIDSISAINYLDLKGTGTVSSKMNFNLNRKSEFSDYNRCLHNIHHICEVLKDPSNDIFTLLTALPRAVDDVVDNKVISPYLNPSSAPAALMSHMDLVGYMYHKRITGGVKQVIQFEPNGLAVSKHIFAEPPFNFERPSFKEIYDKLKKQDND